MLRKLAGKIFGVSIRAPIKLEILFDEARELHAANDYRAAQKKYSEYLQLRPYDAAVMNELACCLASAGDEAEAMQVFEKAHLLDDSNIPVAVNFASVLRSRGRIDDALHILTQAQIQSPGLANIATVYAAIEFALGNSQTSRTFALKGWLADFDDLRLANCFLFNSAYADISEALLAAEHRFWAETLKPFKLTKRFAESTRKPKSTGRKIKIGYWSPDLRSHSVRLFFRPLLEAHNRSKYQIYVYHDSHMRDEQTDLIEQHADQFFDCSVLTNDALSDLFRSHELDVLVEMAGHSSTNRLNLLTQRFAGVQLTGIGYPPTTGLNTIDVKLIDRHINTPAAAKYYTEEPGVIGDSFWCFDPKEQVARPSEPPCQGNGYITFGCVGNIAKITPRMIRCWAIIMSVVPDSRLLLRSINFIDVAAERRMRESLIQAQIDDARVVFRKPAGRAAFYESYNEIDILLDTFPFNGGTTSCFALYMGVPIVSLAGDSLVSRMGQSVLSNLGLADWAVQSEDAYVKRAVKAAGDIQFLSEFRRNARDIFRNSPLGNAQSFTKDFEGFVDHLLTRCDQNPVSQYSHAVEDLDEEEIIRRAYFVYRCGQPEAGRRIVDYCLRAFPRSAAAHILWTERLTSQGDFRSAADHLIEILATQIQQENIPILTNIARFKLLDGNNDGAAKEIYRLQKIVNPSHFERLQIRQLTACLETATVAPTEKSTIVLKSIRLIVITDDPHEFTAIRDHVEQICSRPESATVSFERCSETDRAGIIENAIYEENSQICLILHKNISIANPNFWKDVAAGLSKLDIIGVHGADRWEKIDWDRQRIGTKAGSIIVPSGEKDGFAEVHFFGDKPVEILEDMQVVRGNFLAINAEAVRKFKRIAFDAELCGGGAWMEEFFSFQAATVGCKVGVHQALGIVVDWRTQLCERYLKEARLKISCNLGLPMEFDINEGDERFLSVAVASKELANKAQRTFVQLP